MKNTIALIGVFVVSAIFSVATAQDKGEISKEVRMTDENGVKTLLITTTKNGVATEEKFVGEAAEKKMNELMKEHDVQESEGIEEDVKVEEVDGVKKVTVVRSTKGKIHKEVYMGEKADAKLKELEYEKIKANKSERKMIKREVVVKETSDK